MPSSSPPYDQVLDETRPLAINDRMVYSRSKALAEQEVQNAVKQGLDAVILSPPAIIGPFDYALNGYRERGILCLFGKRQRKFTVLSCKRQSSDQKRG